SGLAGGGVVDEPRGTYGKCLEKVTKTEVPSPEGGAATSAAPRPSLLDTLTYDGTVSRDGTRAGDETPTSHDTASRPKAPIASPALPPQQPAPPTAAKLRSRLLGGLAAARVLHERQVASLRQLEVRRWDADRLVLAAGTPDCYQRVQ